MGILEPQGTIDATASTALSRHAATNAALADASAAADHAAAAAIFTSYREQLAAHTRIAHDQDLVRCALYLADIGVAVGPLAAEPLAWSAFSWGLVEGFKRWMLREGYAVATINRTLATIKSYVRLAAQYGGSSCQDTGLANYPSIAYPKYTEMVDNVLLSMGSVRPQLTPDMHGLPPESTTVID